MLSDPWADEFRGVFLGICVLNWNAGPALSGCLRSIIASSASIRCSIIVVDNCSTDDSVELALRQFPLLRIARSSSNVGYAAGNNLGAQILLKEGCNFLMFVNPDVLLEPFSVSALSRTLLRNREAGCSGGVPSAPEGVSVPARRRPSAFEKIVLYGPLHRIGALRKRSQGHIAAAKDLTDGASVYAVLGACIAFRSEAFRQIEGFDEYTFLYEEEFIIAERLRAKGWKSVVSTGALYSHTIGLSTNQIPYRRRLHFIRSEEYLLRRYYHWNPVASGLLRIYRYLEWIGYALHLSFRNVGQGGSAISSQDKKIAPAAFSTLRPPDLGDLE